jgi:hypothetical protein
VTRSHVSTVNEMISFDPSPSVLASASYYDEIFNVAADLLPSAAQYAQATSAFFLLFRNDQPIRQSGIEICGKNSVIRRIEVSEMRAGLLSVASDANKTREVYEGELTSQYPQIGGGAGTGTVICIPKKFCGDLSFVTLYECDPAASFRSGSRGALELHCIAFACALNRNVDLQDSEALSISEGRTTRAAMGLDPSILRGVAASLAFTINDPLSAVVAHTSAALQWLSKEPPEVEKARSSLRKIASSALKVGGTVASLGMPDDAPNRENTSTNLHKAASDALLALEPDLQKIGASFSNAVSKNILVEAREGEVRQILEHLLDGAIGAMQKAGGPKSIAISCESQAQEAVLSITDTGAMVPSDALEAVFDINFTLQPGPRGIKLGIARALAQLQGGSIKILRSDAKSTTMLLRLPVRAPFFQ